MQVESLSTRLDFDERRARALEGVVQYRPGAPLAPAAAPEGEAGEAPAKRQARVEARAGAVGAEAGGGEVSDRRVLRPMPGFRGRRRGPGRG